MGLFKLCKHKGRQRDRCAHPWWGSFRGYRVSLVKWTGRAIDAKTAAIVALDELRASIRAGTFNEAGLEAARGRPIMTFAELATEYKERHVQAKQLVLTKSIDYRLKPLLERFGGIAIGDIRLAQIEDFIAELRKPRVVNHRSDRMLAPASINRTVELMRHMFNWAIARELLDRSPFRRGSENLIRPELEDNMRRRRISENEEARLIAAAPSHLKTLIITALDTGMRRGEMLALQWSDIDLDQGLITLRGVTTKSGLTRRVPIGTLRLRSVLEWLQLDAAGEKKPGQEPVFSNEVGEPISSFRTAWVLTVLKAHDITPHWSKTSYTELEESSAEAFRRIDLRWHDLRHEYASRLVERNVPLAQVRDLLGHASITTTERYDNQTLESLQVAAQRLERGQTFEVPKPATSKTKFQDSFKIGSKHRNDASRTADVETPANSMNQVELFDWLGGRDSNPDNVVQSHVSYR